MYRLALAVGDATPEQDGGLADRIDLWQLRRWAEYAEVEPWGETRADLRAGIVAATIANVNRGKGARSFKPGDFMPNFEPRKPQTLKQMRNIFCAFAQAHNAAQRGKS